MMLRQRRARTGTILIECALIYPILFMLVLGIILVGLAVFRYQQVSHISREASRWASVHGQAYATDLTNTSTPLPPARTAASDQDVYDNAIAPQAAGMQSGPLTYSVAWGHADSSGNWVTDKNPTYTYTPSGTDPVTGQAYVPVKKSNTVTVTVTYTWNTGLFGTIPVSCTSTNTIQY